MEFWFCEEIVKWFDGIYELDVWIDVDMQGILDVYVYVVCKVKGDQLMVDLIGIDDCQNLVGVWNIFGNICGYIMIQLGSMVDLIIFKNEGLFNVVEFVILEGCIVYLLLNKFVVLGFFYFVCEIMEVVCIVLLNVVLEWV